jgi:UDP-GlcNAc:undecaprenyl-phosphate GlcNAc-1-phosphate transferase
LRVFTLRLLRGRSPFSPDRNHIHHQLIDSGFSHGFTALYLYLIVISVPLISLGFKGYSPTITFFSMLLISIALVHTVFLFRFWKSKGKVSNAKEA